MLRVGSLAQPIMIGREKEFEELLNHLDSAAAGKGVTVFVSGEAGAGKTRLTSEFLNKADQRGVAILSGSCLGNVTVPYFPFIEAFDAYFAPNYGTEDLSFQLGTRPSFNNAGKIGGEEVGITMWLSGPKPTEAFGKSEAMSPQVWRDQTFVAVARTLHSICVQQPLILFLEDIHWADSASLGLLHYIAKVIRSERILILATFRSEELNVDEEGHPHPLVEALQLMRRENLFEEVRLQGLDNQNIGKVAESMVNGSIDPQLVKKLAEESQGNPLFVVESLRMLHERKSLFQDNNQWRLAVDELGIPSKIKEIILRRLGTLKLSQRRVLDAASVIGDKFNIELLGAVLKQDSLEVLETLNFVAQSTSLVCCEKDYFRFDHAKSRETLYEEIPLPLQKGYHSRIAEKLEASAKGEDLPLSEMAYHYAKAGNQEKALKFSMAAGKEALSRFSNNEAIAHFKYVLDTIGEAPEHSNERLLALEGLGDAYQANSLFKEAAKIFELLASLATGITKLRAFNKAIGATFVVGDYNHTNELLKCAEEVPVADRLEGAKLSFAKGSSLWGRGKPLEAMEVCKGAVGVFEEEYSLWNLATFLTLFGVWCCFVDKLEEGVTALLRSIALSGDLEDYCLQAITYQTAGQLIHVNCGAPEEASSMLAKSIPIAEKIADYNKLAETYCVWSWTFEAKGNLREAINKGLQAKEFVEKTDSERVKAMVFSSLARQYVRFGDMGNAEKYCNKLLSIPKEILYTPGPQGFQTLALFFAAKGKWKESNEYFKKQFELNKKLTPGARMNFNRNYAWALEKQGQVEEARKLREQAQAGWEELAKRFEHVNLQIKFMAPINVVVGQEFEARLDIANPSRGKGSIVRIEKLLPPEFKILTHKPECNLHNDIVEMEENALDPFTVKTVKFTLKATKTGAFNLAPQVVYVDDTGQTKTCSSSMFRLSVKTPEPAFETLPGRLSTGTAELDYLLLGGLPQVSATVLSSPSCNERDQLIKRFIEFGEQTNELVFYLSCNLNNLSSLIKENSTNFYCLICNNQADSVFPNLPNVFKLRGVENLTEIDIALTKAFRSLNLSAASPRRACIDLISDVLLQHGAVVTRKWLSNLLPLLKSKGLTTLILIDYGMHRPEELQAVVSLFDGQVKIIQKETEIGTKKFLRVERLSGKRFLEDELQLTKEK